ncbi:hypothetical protein SAMN06265370_106221 [Puniceibacterium sediminis]|uniref:Uncharacterized protein n=1 Tax=Puniceibacterium sediminis TaxID=1608407 RepID=A0A238WPJ2_9RHOB|nr:hypothetical protein SAMN06265370_106221 [Puniceibacterium sediminis]
MGWMAPAPTGVGMRHHRADGAGVLPAFLLCRGACTGTCADRCHDRAQNRPRAWRDVRLWRHRRNRGHVARWLCVHLLARIVRDTGCGHGCVRRYGVPFPLAGARTGASYRHGHRTCGDGPCRAGVDRTKDLRPRKPLFLSAHGGCFSRSSPARTPDGDRSPRAWHQRAPHPDFTSYQSCAKIRARPYVVVPDLAPQGLPCLGDPWRSGCRTATLKKAMREVCSESYRTHRYPCHDGGAVYFHTAVLSD